MYSKPATFLVGTQWDNARYQQHDYFGYSLRDSGKRYAMLRDLREAVRSLISNPSFSLVVIVTLSLAIGVNTTIFSALNSVILRPLNYDEPDRIVMLWENNLDLGIDQELVSAATYIDWRERSRTLSSIAVYRHRG